MPRHGGNHAQITVATNIATSANMYTPLAEEYRSTRMQTYTEVQMQRMIQNEKWHGKGNLGTPIINDNSNLALITVSLIFIHGWDCQCVFFLVT